MVKNLKRACLYLVSFTFVYVIVDISGVFRHPLERDYYTEFSYPLDVENFPELVRKFREGEYVSHAPINRRYSSLKFINNVTTGCSEPLRLLVLVKSAVTHFRRRDVIRASWGAQRFTDVRTKTVFLLGQGVDDDKMTIERDGKRFLVKDLIDEEILRNDDVVRADFVDSYYNNTLKTMMGMRWAAAGSCSDFQFIFFVDDDMYVSVKNLLKFVRHPTGYPKYWETMKTGGGGGAGHGGQVLPQPLRDNLINTVKTDDRQGWRNAGSDFDIELRPNAKLYGGYVFFVPPHRHKIGTKWFLPLEEYPFNYFPPYVPAGAIVMSRAAFRDIYYASFYTQHFRFDDIFVALCAKKMNIEPYHSNYFRFWEPATKNPREEDFKYVITQHGFSDPEELLQFWNVQKSLGNA